MYIYLLCVGGLIDLVQILQVDDSLGVKGYIWILGRVHTQLGCNEGDW